MTYKDSLAFLSEKWSKLSPDQKLEVIQTIENHEAEINGRNPCPVEGKFLYTGQDGIVLGQYDRETRAIYINDSQLAPDSKYGNSFDRITQTALHEGRHSYQHQTVEGEINHTDTKELEVWKNNFDKYISFKEDPRGYYAQPIEVDARKYADERFKQMMEEKQNISEKNLEEISDSFIPSRNNFNTQQTSINIRNSILAQPSVHNEFQLSNESKSVTEQQILTNNEAENNEISAKDVFVSQVSDENALSAEHGLDENVNESISEESTVLDDGESEDEGISM